MNTPLESKKVLVKKSPIHGYGVFAAQNIKEGEVIEECYSPLVNGDDIGLKNYYFSCNQDKTKSFLPLGNGSIYNHAKHPTAEYFLDEERSVFIYKALSPIKAGEEIFINYGEEWFSLRKMTCRPNIKVERKKFFLSVTRFAFVIGAIYAVITLLNMVSMVPMPM